MESVANYIIREIYESEKNMSDFDDPLDLLDDDGDGVVEMSLLEDEEKRNKTGSSNKNGCCFIFLILSSSLVITGWYVCQLII